MIGRRGLLGGLLAGPAIIRTPGLLMPISLLPYALIRLYGYDHAGEDVRLVKTLRVDNPAINRAGTMAAVPLDQGVVVWRASLELHGISRRFDRQEVPLNIGGPRFMRAGDNIGVSNISFEHQEPGGPIERII